VVATQDNLKTDRQRHADRGPEKPGLLFIDYAVPQYDLFAGSRTNFMYLQMLVEMGFEVIFLAEDFHPLEPYTSELEQMGVETLVGDWYRQHWESWLRDNGLRLDYVFMHKPDPAAFFLPAVRRYSKAAVIYQCHDLHYLRLRRKAEIEGDPAARDEADHYERKEDFIFANSDVLLTFSEMEEKIIREKYPGKPVFTVPLFFYRDPACPKSDFNRRQGLIFVGACAHSPNRDAVSWFCSEVFPLIRERLPGMVLNVVGAEPPAEIAALQSDNIRILGRVSEARLAELYNTVRMMVVPLRFGAGVKGKVIETMHNGLPFVSTSTGLEGIRGIERILPARDSARDFADAVVSTYNDEARLQELSLLGAQFVDAGFSMENTMSMMSRILDEAKEQASQHRSGAIPDRDFATAGQGDGHSSDHAGDGGTGGFDDGQEDARIKGLQIRISELEKSLARSERQIAEIYESTSWKVSSPLRWVRRLLSGAEKPSSG
jgi:glycosyltransferase involved in cell wall biosynthesis